MLVLHSLSQSPLLCWSRSLSSGPYSNFMAHILHFHLDPSFPSLSQSPFLFHDLYHERERGMKGWGKRERERACIMKSKDAYKNYNLESTYEKPCGICLFFWVWSSSFKRTLSSSIRRQSANGVGWGFWVFVKELHKNKTRSLWPRFLQKQNFRGNMLCTPPRWADRSEFTLFTTDDYWLLVRLYGKNKQTNKSVFSPHVACPWDWHLILKE